MQPTTAATLLRLNRAFYDRFAAEFSGSRTPNQPGWQRLLNYLPARGRLLDVGCGNGRLAHLLDQQAWPVAYVGVDSSARLLALARANASMLSIPNQFVEADVSAAGWEDKLPAGPYDAVAALALLHHVPGWQRRRDLLAQLASLLAGDGVLALSTWQFLNEARLRRKVVDWSAAGLTPDQIEPGDYLLDWQRGGAGLRYCHLVDETELAGLAASAGLRVQEIYYDDGRHKNLNLFAVLQRAR
jgi:tRNA (uracil-5-)-methyltransferase TRM9